MAETATEIRRKMFHRDDAENRMKRAHKDFREKWAPQDERDRDQFEVELVMLIQAVYRDAQQPFVDAAAAHLATRPMPPVVIQRKKGQTDG